MLPKQPTKEEETYLQNDDFTYFFTSHQDSPNEALCSSDITHHPEAAAE